MGIKDSNGFWNTIEKADLNGDGFADLLVGNLGENTFFKASDQKPLKMHIKDFDNNGKIIKHEKELKDLTWILKNTFIYGGGIILGTVLFLSFIFGSGVIN